MPQSKLKNLIKENKKFLIQPLFLIKGMELYKLDIVHCDNVIFGPGLVAAYESEMSIAKYPRIVIDEVNSTGL